MRTKTPGPAAKARAKVRKIERQIAAVQKQAREAMDAAVPVVIEIDEAIAGLLPSDVAQIIEDASEAMAAGKLDETARLLDSARALLGKVREYERGQGRRKAGKV
jgi:thioesterase domain-containing protein